MPFICIGPVCIPWTAVAPILIFICRPIWSRLPPAYQQAFTSRYEALQGKLQASVWDRIGWKAAAKKAPPTASELAAADDGGGGASKLLASRGGVVGLHTDAEWAAAVALTKSSDVALIVDFTAVWCGPCQRIAPDFARLAKAHPKALFVKVDVDELEDVMQEAGVVAMPTFQVYAKGKLSDSLTGASVEKLENMVGKAAA